VTDSVPDVSPTAGEVLGEEIDPAPIVPVPVVVAGPVRIQRRQNKTGNIYQINLVQNAAPELIVGRDPRRARVFVYARGGLVRLATRVVDFEHSRYIEIVNGTWGVPIEFDCDIYVATAAASVAVAVVVEYWTD
jgi:hypothetical protein